MIGILDIQAENKREGYLEELIAHNNEGIQTVEDMI